MNNRTNTAQRKFKLLCSVGAVAALSACASLPTAPSGPTGHTAGAPSTHIPQNYQTMTSVAAVTSTVGGSSAVRSDGPIGGWFGSMTSVSTSGSVVHDTGRIELDDGTYLFVDVNGPDALGNVSDGVAGATGTLGLGLPAYTYVTEYHLTYNANGTWHEVNGVAGIVTSASDMPSGGTATYSGDAYAFSIDTTTTATTNNFGLQNGVSTVAVDFGAGTATVNLDTFTKITGTGAQTFDQIQGSGIVISGAHFTGGTWVTMLGGVPVDVVGANVSTTSNGTFFGYDANVSAPAEVGGVVSSVGSTGFVLGVYAAAGL